MPDELQDPAAQVHRQGVLVCLPPAPLDEPACVDGASDEERKEEAGCNRIEQEVEPAVDHAGDDAQVGEGHRGHQRACIALQQERSPQQEGHADHMDAYIHRVLVVGAVEDELVLQAEEAHARDVGR